MGKLTAESVLERHEDIAFRVVDGAAVLVSPRDAKIVTLNEVGTRVWELLDGRPLGEIARALVEDFEVDEPQALEDAATFAEDLLLRGLATERGAA